MGAVGRVGPPCASCRSCSSTLSEPTGPCRSTLYVYPVACRVGLAPRRPKVPLGPVVITHCTHGAVGRLHAWWVLVRCLAPWPVLGLAWWVLGRRTAHGARARACACVGLTLTLTLTLTLALPLPLALTLTLTLTLTTQDGWEPLHAAAHGGHMAVVQWLVEHGADIRARANNG